MRRVAFDLEVLEAVVEQRRRAPLDDQRGQRPRLARELQAGLLEVVVVQVDVAADPEPPAPAWLDITPEQVQAALAKIGDEFRVVYELATSQNRSYKEIAAELRLPAATVGTRLIRARRKLRRLLTPLVREAA